MLNILIFGATFSSVLSQNLHFQFPLFGLSEVVAKGLLKYSTDCTNQLKSLHDAVQKHETWALRMLDSSGAPSNGFIWGNNYWLGTYSQCRWIASKKPTVSFSSSQTLSLSPPFDVDFYVTIFKHNTSLQAEVLPNELHLGLCLPTACTPEELTPLLIYWAKQKPLLVQSLYNFSLEFKGVRLVRSDFSWMYNPLTIILGVIMSTAILLTIFGSIYDIYVWSPIRRRKAVERPAKNNNEIVKVRNIQEGSKLLNQDNYLNESIEVKMDHFQKKSISIQPKKSTKETEVQEPKQNALAKLSLCFSVTSNFKILLESHKKPNELAVIHGLHFFGMIWLIWLYSVFYLKHFADNKPMAQSLSESFSEIIISNSTFSVDTFFFTSGFILAFKYYKGRRDSLKPDRHFSIKKQVNEFCKMALKRYLRLTPGYAVVLAWVLITVKTIRKTSLFEIIEPADEICEKYWWRNIAYLNNLYNGDEMCMSWSWYLSSDMQFFLLGVLILIISTRFKKFAAFISIALVILSSLITGYLSYGHQYISSIQPQLALLHVLYYSPWTRVGPFLIGMCTGYFVFHLKGELVIKRIYTYPMLSLSFHSFLEFFQIFSVCIFLLTMPAVVSSAKRLDMSSKATLVSCWLMWSLCNIWALFGLYSRSMSIVPRTIHAALSRTVWGLCLCWMVTACYTGNAGVIKAILAYRGWVPFSKISYSAYLLSPLIINLIISSAETAMHLDFFQMVVCFVGNLGITYISAFCFSVVLEIPLATLGKGAIGKMQSQNQLNKI